MPSEALQQNLLVHTLKKSIEASTSVEQAADHEDALTMETPQSFGGKGWAGVHFAGRGRL